MHGSLERLSTLRKEIAALQIVKCHMSHERVLTAADSMLPVVRSVPAGSYQRVGLCSPEVRAQRLGCSHSMARIKLEDAIRELEPDGNKPGAPTSFLGRELNWLDNEIHLLDHRKGEAEKTRARILEEVHAAADRASAYEQLRKTEEELGEMERLHDEYVDRLARLRDRIVAEIDELTESQ